MYSTPRDEQYVRFKFVRTCRRVTLGRVEPRMSRYPVFPPVDVPSKLSVLSKSESLKP